MATVKNFGLAGIAGNVQFGKSGGKTLFNTDHFEMKSADESSLLELYVATPDNSSSDNAATTKAYVDSVATGLDVKTSVKVATVSALPANTFNDNGSAGLGQTLTATGNGALTIDGVTGFSVADRVLVKDEATASNNGIYVVTDAGGASAQFILTRATDSDNTPSNEVSGGLFTFVEEGTVNADAGFVLSAPTGNADMAAGTPDDLVFTQFSGAGSITAGDGLQKIGNEISVDLVGASVLGVSAGELGIQGGVAGQSLLSNGAGEAAFGALDISDNVNNISGVLPQTNGGMGTDVSSFADGSIMLTDGTGGITELAAGATGTVLKGVTGSDPVFGSIDLAADVGATVLPVTSGGTGLNTATTGDILFASASNTMSKLAIGTNGQSLTVTGGLPTWSAVDISDNVNAITGTLATANGGTGLSAIAENSIMAANTANVLSAVTASGLADQVLLYNNTSGDIEWTDTSNIGGVSWATIQGDSGADMVADTTSDTMAINGGAGITTVAGDGAPETMTISLNNSGLSDTATTSSDIVIFFDADATDTPATRTWAGIVSDLGLVEDADFAANGIMVRTGAGAYANRAITVAGAGATAGLAVSNGNMTGADAEIGLDLANLAAAAGNPVATDVFVMNDGVNNEKVTMQQVADATQSLININNTEIVSADTFTKVDTDSKAGSVEIFTDVSSAADKLAEFKSSVADFEHLFTNAAGEIRWEAGDGTGFGSSSTADVDIRLVPGANGQVFLGNVGVNANIGASNSSTGDGENLTITGGDSTFATGNGGDITLTPGESGAGGIDGKVCVTDDDGENVMCFTGVDTALHAVELTNAATGNAPSFAVVASGVNAADANVDLNFAPRGTGALTVTPGSGVYADNVTDVNDIPNKGYVDSAVGTATAGAVGTITATVDLTSDSAQAVGTVPAGATVTKVMFNIGTASNAATTVAVAGSASYMGAAENDPEATGLYVSDVFVLEGSAQAVNATVATAGSTGTGTVIVEYRNA